MAKHLVKCKICGETFDTNEEEFVKVNANRYAHKTCVEEDNKKKTKEELDKEKLEAYIKELFNINTLTPKIKQQLKQFIGQYTYSGMLGTLKYFFEVKGNPIEKANGGIGIIPYVYWEAKAYYQALYETQQENRKVIEVEQITLPIREIHILPPKREPMKHIRKLFSFLEENEGNE